MFKTFRRFPDLVEKDGVGITGDLLEGKLQQLLWNFYRSSNLLQERRRFFSRFFVFRILALAIEIVHQVLDLERASDSEWADRVDHVRQVHPCQRLIHAIDNEIETQVRTHGQANGMTVRDLRDGGDVFVR